MKKKHKCYYCKGNIDEDNIVSFAISEKTNRHFHKDSKCYDKYLFGKENKCFHCKKKINFDDYVFNNDKYYHKECYIENTIKIQEQEEWNKLYTFVKEKILKYPKEISLSKTQMFALKELREGNLITRGTKQKYNGYTYFDIYTAFVLNQHSILKSLQGKSFKNENSKFKYIIAIVRNNINDIVLNRLEKEEIKRRINNIEFETKLENTYSKKSTCGEKEKLLNLLNNSRW